MISLMADIEDKITIIEGSPPEFENVSDAWVLGLNETLGNYELALTRLRTFNGQALVERCHRTWKNNLPMYLQYKNTVGLEDQVPIMAVRNVDTSDGQVLFIWVRWKRPLSNN
jgi:hypothetical protein